ncbi:SDR family NAD(P)-dependent oxidoreductase [Xenorhabdus bovienii]|uniref:Uncharacterized oxidoreductase YjgI n=1 Tax=Xenorhabdus bovienii str. kraussei Becker Underwood TaxID=1398204 RepID=A0A077PP15_XENBV|nr:SDR family oxidoreductase [Xenorhabdus bovienii]CDH22501.1 Uncharacterized oxidoreductase YjgI [Xenorhabdus bovienii str. kraussei Becker Underwood]
MSNLSGKIALITGGSRGIGAGIAKRLAQEGADVVITYVNNSDAAKAVVEDIINSGRVGKAIRADSADADAIKLAVKQIIKQFGQIDILINNAGHMDVSGTPLPHVPLDVVNQTIMVNIRGSYLFAQEVASHISDNGRIINIGSCLGERMPVAGLTLYAMSKSAMVGLTKGLARDLAYKKVTVNQISPGPVDTDLNPADGPNADFFRELTALKQYGTTNDITSIVNFLVSREAAFITGANIAVDGGMNL